MFSLYAQADLSLLLAQKSEGTFPPFAAQINDVFSFDTCAPYKRSLVHTVYTTSLAHSDQNFQSLHWIQHYPLFLYAKSERPSFIRRPIRESWPGYI